MNKSIPTLSVLVFTCLVGCTGKPEDAPAAESKSEATSKQSLTIWWARWAPADVLSELAKEFNPNVSVTVHQIPWQSFQDH